MRALRPGAAGLEGSAAHTIDGESHKQMRSGQRTPWPDLRSFQETQIRRGGFTDRRAGAERGVAGCPRRRGSGRPSGSRSGEGFPPQCRFRFGECRASRFRSKFKGLQGLRCQAGEFREWRDCNSGRLQIHYIADFIGEFWRTRQDSNLWPSPSEGDALSS